MSSSRRSVRKPSPVHSNALHGNQNNPTQSNDLPYSENDILLKRGGIVSQRSANKFYHSFLQSNVMVYKSLPKDLRTQFSNNIFSFLVGPCGRNIIQYRPEFDDYVPLTWDTAAPAVSAAIRDDRVAKACCTQNPLWILGLHHRSVEREASSSEQAAANFLPYVCCQNGVWHHPKSHDELQSFLLHHGLQNMLILPPGMELPEQFQSTENDAAMEDVTTHSEDAADSFLRQLESSNPSMRGGSNSNSNNRNNNARSSQSGHMGQQYQPQETPSFDTFAASQQSSNNLFEEAPAPPELNRVISGSNNVATERTSSSLRRDHLRLSMLRRSCSTISLSDVEDGGCIDDMMDEGFEGFEFTQPAMEFDPAMQSFLFDSLADDEIVQL